MGIGYYGCSSWGWYVLKAVMFILASFVFSIVFWATKHWLEKGSPKKKK